MTELLLNKQIYDSVIQTEIPQAEKFVWIATADIKDLHVERGGKGKYQPFLQLLADLLQDGVEIRLVHAKEPGPRFRADFDRFPELVESELFERVLCVRMHAKIIIVDGKVAYTGSANLTGAGVGAKSPLRRTSHSKPVRHLGTFEFRISIGGRFAAIAIADKNRTTGSIDPFSVKIGLFGRRFFENSIFTSRRWMG